MADERIVKQKLRRLLQSVDFETETQRSITKKLEEELGVNLSQHKPMIKDEIDTFLTEQQDAEDDADDDYEAEAAAAPPAKKKLKGAGGGAAPAPPQGDLVVPLSATRFATVRQLGGRAMVDVREFYEKDGKLQPGRKGVALQAAAWTALVQSAAALSAAVEGRDLAFCLDLGASKRATISAFKGRHSVDLREHYEKDGQMLPGKKGISLSEEEWGKLCAAAGQISGKLGAAGGGGGPAAPAAAGPGGAAGPSGAGAAAGAQAGAAAASASAGGVDLSSSRRADVSRYKGSLYVNIREYYEKDGQKLPGKKGISLPPDQFASLRQRAADLDAALKGHNTGYEVQLSNKRKASISNFKGRFLVNIREYYEKDGQQLPGQKGISLPEEQWGKLLGGLPGLAAALDAA